MIKDELWLALISAYCGIILIIIHDVIRIWRSVIKSSFIHAIIEEIIFWVLAAYIFFNVLIKYNFGILRVYPIAIMFLAMAGYEMVIGGRFVNFIVKYINKVVKSLLKPLKNKLKPIKLKKRKRINSKKQIKLKKRNKVI